MIAPLRDQEGRWAFWLLLPALFGIGFFTVIPTLGSFLLSFTSWDLLGAPQWVGGANYQDLAQDPLFWRVLAQTGSFVLMYVALDAAIALALALALNQKIRAVGLLRTAYFMPVVCSMVAGAILWSWIYDPRYGLLNAVLAAWHVAPVRWLTDSHWAMPALVLVSVWKNLGYDMLLFLAGLQAVPSQQIEAASLDGANAWQRFRHVTLPLIAPTLVMVGIMATIRAFQTFDTVFLMTEGGPHRSTTIIGYWLFQNAFTYFKLGKAAALAYVLFAILVALSALQWVLRRRVGHHEEVAA